MKTGFQLNYHGDIVSITSLQCTVKCPADVQLWPYDLYILLYSICVDLLFSMHISIPNLINITYPKPFLKGRNTRFYVEQTISLSKHQSVSE